MVNATSPIYVVPGVPRTMIVDESGVRLGAVVDALQNLASRQAGAGIDGRAYHEVRTSARNYDEIVTSYGGAEEAKKEADDDCKDGEPSVLEE